jgi:hypothetical protein
MSNIGGMSLRAFFLRRRQRKARKRYEREKALRAAQNDEQAMKRVTDGGGFGSGIGS